MSEPFRVLVVDDSALSREALRRALELDGGLAVVGEAATGEEAIAAAERLAPELVTMDLHMPGMGGLRAIEVLMRDRPLPIVVISERSSTPGMDLNYEALSRGALELVPKSAVFGRHPDDVRRFAARMRGLVAARAQPDVRPSPTPRIAVTSEAPLLLGVGASTGGPKALARLLAELPLDFPIPVAVVQHMAEDFFDSFVRFLGDASRRAVQPAEAGAVMRAGQVYVAPPRKELFVKENLTVKLLPPPRDALISPSVDSLFFSMATALKGRGIGVLLTGMGDDGAQGLLRMRRMGARTVAQDRASCAVFGMPRAAVEVGAAEHVLPLEAMAGWLRGAVVPGGSGAGARPEAPAAAGRTVPPLPHARRRTRVLVVDDDPQVLARTRALLAAEGYEVQTLDNALMLAGTLRRRTVDLVLFETELKTVQGELVLKALRDHGLTDVPVLLHSSLPLQELEAKARSCQAAGHVRKGSPGVLAEVVRLLGEAARTKGGR